MHEDFKKYTKDLQETRRRLVELHTALYDRMFDIFKEQKLIDKREQLKDAQIRQYCLSHQFHPVTRVELNVIVAELRQLHDTIAKLDAEIRALYTQWQEQQKPAGKSLQIDNSVGLELEGYGAPEIKRSWRRNMSWALGIAAAIHIALISLYWTVVSLQPTEEKPRVMRVYKYVELGPPPSITDTYKPAGGQASLPGASNVSRLGMLGMLARVVPISDKDRSKRSTSLLIDENSLDELDRLLSQAPLQRGGGGLGDGVSGLGGNGQGYGSGQGNGSGYEVPDQVVLDDFKFKDLSNVDELINDDRKLESVQLEKKGQVNIQPPSKMHGSQAAMGQRNAESVMSIVNSQQGRIMYTYNKYLKTDPSMSGKVSMDVTIEATGVISSIAVVEANISNQNFVSELVNIIRRLRFDPIPEGSLTVNLPFVFSRVD